MKHIAPPPPGAHPDRFLMCQEAMANAFSDVALSAVSAGWQPEEVVAALVELADNAMLGVIANRQVALDLAAIQRK